jgi:CDP-glycerol glycerophosphotransferase
VPVNATCLRPIVARLAGDPRLDLRLTSRWRGNRWAPGRLTRALPESHAALRRVRTVPAPLAGLRRFDLYLSPDMVPTGARRAARKIHLFHGVSFKGASISPKALVYDHLFLFGEYQRRRFVEKRIVEDGDPRLEVIGWPKLDCLVDGSLDRDAIRRDLSLSGDRPVVLYAPTWRGTSLDADGEAIVDALAGLDVDLIIKLHDHSLDPGLARRSWDEQMAGWAGRSNVAVWSDPDVCPALMAADLLVSDFSSVANEFALLDRPTVFFDTPDLTVRYSAKQIDHAMLARRGELGLVVDRPEALREAVTQALEHPTEHSAARQALARDLFHEPGTATDRAVKRILEILGLSD